MVDGCRCRQKKSRPHSIVSWNLSSSVALVSMHKVDLILGSIILGLFVVVALNGVIWSVV